MQKLQERMIEESKNEEPPAPLSKEESEKLLPVKSISKDINLDVNEYVPPQFENLENHALEDIKQEYDNIDQYNANREGEGHAVSENSDEITKDPNLLPRELDPVEEEEKEENSQKMSATESQNELEPDHIPQHDQSEESVVEAEGEETVKE